MSTTWTDVKKLPLLPSVKYRDYFVTNMNISSCESLDISSDVTCRRYAI